MTRLREEKKTTPETSLKQGVKDYLALMHIFSYPIQQGLGSFPGLPDRVIHINGHVEYLELKTTIGKLSPAQITFEEQCQRDGIPYHVIRSLDDLIKIIGTKRKV